jgi:hypothetical protein
MPSELRETNRVTTSDHDVQGFIAENDRVLQIVKGDVGPRGSGVGDSPSVSLTRCSNNVSSSSSLCPPWIAPCFLRLEGTLDDWVHVIKDGLDLLLDLVSQNSTRGQNLPNLDLAADAT